MHVKKKTSNEVFFWQQFSIDIELSYQLFIIFHMLYRKFFVLVGWFFFIGTSYPFLFASSEFFQYAQSLANIGVINTQSSEYGYRLSSTISRAEATKLALGAAGIAQRDCRALSHFSFADVNGSLWTLCGYVESAVTNNIIASSTRFYPSIPIIRGDFADIIVKSFDLSYPSLIGNSAVGVVYYTDVPASLPAANSINRLAITGCINTRLTNFRPYASISRGEAFKIMECLVKQVSWIRNYELWNQVVGTGISDISSQSGQSVSSYIWYTTSYGSCSKACGGGVQTRGVSCKKIIDNSVVTDSYCIATWVVKPLTQKLCNVNMCESTVVNTVSNNVISPGTSPSTSLGVTTVSSQWVPWFPWIIQGVSYNSLAEVREVYKSPCIEINKIYSAVGFWPCISGTSTNITPITSTTNTATNSTSSSSLSGQALIDALCTKYSAQGAITCQSSSAPVVEALPQAQCEDSISGMTNAGVWNHTSAGQVLIMDYRNAPEYYEFSKLKNVVWAQPFVISNAGWGSTSFADCIGAQKSTLDRCRIMIYNDSPLAIYAPKECVLDINRKYYYNHFRLWGPQVKVTPMFVKTDGYSWKKKATKTPWVQLTCPQNVSTGMLCFSAYELCNNGNEQYECSPGGVVSNVITTPPGATSSLANTTTTNVATWAKVTPWPATKCDTPIAGMHSAGFWRPKSATQVLIMAYWNVPEYYELDNENIKEITQNLSFNVFSDGGSPYFSDCPGTKQSLLCGTRWFIFDDSPYAKYAPKECVLDSNRKYYLNHTYSGPQVKFNPNMPNNGYVWKKRTEVNPSFKLTCPDGIHEGYNCGYYTQVCNSGTDQYICQPQSNTVL